MIKGLDDDEVDFLDLVDRTKMEEERKKAVEEEREIADFRNRVATLQEQGLEQRIQQEIRQQPLKINNAVKTGRTSQTKLLAGAVVKKRPSPNGNESAAKESPACKRQREDESTPPRQTRAIRSTANKDLLSKRKRAANQFLKTAKFSRQCTGKAPCPAWPSFLDWALTTSPVMKATHPPT
uniref:FAM192A/Fyv6 N-terminal domain-containing protein n=1 Tax=Lygus hesperus TaxID=30085 RepID=A0A0A9Z5M9_LYGHE